MFHGHVAFEKFVDPDQFVIFLVFFESVIRKVYVKYNKRTIMQNYIKYGDTFGVPACAQRDMVSTLAYACTIRPYRWQYVRHTVVCVKVS